MRALIAAILLWQASLAPHPLSEPTSFRYRRVVSVPSAAHNAEACATLDGAVYAHALPSLKDLYLFRPVGWHDLTVPYSITVSEPAQVETESATARNVVERGAEIEFDLAMPPRPYTDVLLDLDAHNFIASAEVSGSRGARPSTPLGTFPVFDFSEQHLGRDTTLPLQESSFSALHIVLRFAPGSVRAAHGTIVRGATVPPSREAQTVYTVVAQTTNFAQQGRETVARLPLPAHVPVERISVDLEPAFTANFSRKVVVVARTAATADAERLTGLVERVHLERAGLKIKQEQLGFPAILGANLQTDATVEVRIQNENNQPLPLRAVRLDMRERRLCFPAESFGSPPWEYLLFYGDPTADAPHEAPTPLVAPSSHLVAATLSPESPNPHYVAPKLPLRSLTERHPELLWVALLAVVCILAVVAIHSAKRLPR